MALRWIVIFLSLLICSALNKDKEKPSKLICEIRKFGVFSVGECLPDFVMCDNGLDFVDKCQDGYFFDETDMLCKTPHESFCQHLVEENVERICAVMRKSPIDNSVPTTGPLVANDEEDRVVLVRPIQAADPIYDPLSHASQLGSNHDVHYKIRDQPIQAAQLTPTYDPLFNAGPLSTKDEEKLIHEQPVNAAPINPDDSSLSDAGPLLVNHEDDRVVYDQLIQAVPLAPINDPLFNAGPLNANHHDEFVIHEQPIHAAPINPHVSSLSNVGPLLANHEDDHVVFDQPIQAVPLAPINDPLFKADPLNANHHSEIVIKEQPVLAAPINPHDSSLSDAGPLFANHEDDRVVFDQPIQSVPLAPINDPLLNAGPLSTKDEEKVIHEQPVLAAPINPHDSSLSNAGPLLANHEDDSVILEQPVNAAPINPSDSSLSNVGPLLANHEDDRVVFDQPIQSVPLAPINDPLFNAGPLNANHHDEFVTEEQPIHAAPINPNDSSLSNAGPLLANHEDDRVIPEQPIHVAPINPHDTSLSDAGPLLANHEDDSVILEQPVNAAPINPSDSSLSDAGLLLANHEDDRVVFDPPIQAVPLAPINDPLFNAVSLSTKDEEKVIHEQPVLAAPINPHDSSLSNAGPLNANHHDEFVTEEQPIKAAPINPDDSSLSNAGPLLANHEDVSVIPEQHVIAAPINPHDTSLSDAGPLFANHEDDHVVFDQPIQSVPLAPINDPLLNAGRLNANHHSEIVTEEQPIHAAPINPDDSSLSNAGPLVTNHEDDREHPIYHPKNHRVADEFDRVSLINLQDVYPLETPVIDRFDGKSVPNVLINPFDNSDNVKKHHNDGFDRGFRQDLPAVSPFKAPSLDSPVVDRFEGEPVPQLLNNAFVHFSEKHRPKYQRNVQPLDAPLKEGSGTVDDEDLGLFWRNKRSVDLKKCPIKQYSYRPMFRRPNVTSSHIPHIRTVDDSNSLPSLREMFDNAPDTPSTADPECFGRENGYTYSSGMCRSTFHRCFHGAKIRHSCALTGQVFDDVSKVCVARADLIGCRPSKPIIVVPKNEFDVMNLCRNHADGLYRHPNSCHRIIQCFGNETFERPSCDHELAFDERRGICDYRQNVPGCESFADVSTSNKNPQSVIGCNGSKHGDYIPIKNDCNSFYRCVWDILERMKCPSGTVFNPKINVCDYPNQVQCNAAN